MKLCEVLSRADELKPNAYPAEEKVRWISELSGTIWNEAGKWAGEEKPELPYDWDRDMEKELPVEDAYADLYIKYLFAQIDFHNGDFTRYNASAAMYQAEYDSYAAFLRREHLPDRDVKFKNF